MTYAYDGEGRRVKRTLGGQTTVYVYDAMGELAAEYGGETTGSGLQYLTADALGSTRLVTNASAGAVCRLDYPPFGEEIPAGVGGRSALWSACSGLTLKFTGKERDAETGLDYFEARYFSAAQGRFTSPDPSNLSVDWWVPQSWNRYAYALNNPLAYVDQNGLWPTGIHNVFIREAFPGLTEGQLRTLEQASYNTDFNNRVGGRGPQEPENSFIHGMSDGVNGQGGLAAQAMGDNFIAANENRAKQLQAEWIASGHTGICPAALTAFGNGLHTVMDRTSPSHAGNQPWYGVWGHLMYSANHVRLESSDAGFRGPTVQAMQMQFLLVFGSQQQQQAVKRPDPEADRKPRPKKPPCLKRREDGGYVQ